MTENPQWYADNQWRLWELHFEEMIQDAYENPQVEVYLPIKHPFVIHEAREILKETK